MNLLDHALDALFEGRYPRYAFPVLAEYHPPKRVSQEVELAFRHLQIRCLLLVDRQLQLAHDLAQSCKASSLCPSDTGSRDRRRKSRCVSRGFAPAEHLPSQHERPHVKIRQQW